MHILTSDQVRAWDEYTIRNEPIASIDLMERAAESCVTWLLNNGFRGKNFAVFCGKGNNGGDGLAMARLLAQSGSIVSVYVPQAGSPGTADYQINLQRLHPTKAILTFITSLSDIPEIRHDTVIIDALFGTGLNRPPEGLVADVIKKINQLHCTVVAVDIPSGLPADDHATSDIIIQADITLSFQCYKPAFIVAENDKYIGSLHILDIRLSTAYPSTISPAYIFVDGEFAASHFKPRKKFAHKGQFGHVLLVSGSYGKMGAAVLAAKAALVAGAGLLTVHVPRCGYQIVQIKVPEAMVHTDADENICTEINNLDLPSYASIGIGPGLGTAGKTSEALRSILRDFGKPIVLDADALNLISNSPSLLSSIPVQSILTPHPKEFERLAGICKNDFDRIAKAREFARNHKCTVVLKGHYTCIATSDKLYVNSTGNAGMAKGGSGDVLTGIISSLLGQGYSPEIAAILGVFLHGSAADIALKENAFESMLASDIIDHLPKAFRLLY